MSDFSIPTTPSPNGYGPTDDSVPTGQQPPEGQSDEFETKLNEPEDDGSEEGIDPDLDPDYEPSTTGGPEVESKSGGGKGVKGGDTKGKEPKEGKAEKSEAEEILGVSAEKLAEEIYGENYTQEQLDQVREDMDFLAFVKSELGEEQLGADFNNKTIDEFLSKGKVVKELLSDPTKLALFKRTIEADILNGGSIDLAPAPVGDAVPAPADVAVPVTASYAAPVPAGDAVPAPADDTVPAPADDTVPAPADDTVPAPADDTVPAPADHTVPAPADDTVPAPADDTMPAPADDTVPAPADDTVPAPADDTVPAPADDTVPTGPTPTAQSRTLSVKAPDEPGGDQSTEISQFSGQQPNGYITANNGQAYIEGVGGPIDTPEGFEDGVYFVSKELGTFKVNEDNDWQQVDPQTGEFMEDGLVIERNGEAISVDDAFEKYGPVETGSRANVPGKDGKEGKSGKNSERRSEGGSENREYRMLSWLTPQTDEGAEGDPVLVEVTVTSSVKEENDTPAPAPIPVQPVTVVETEEDDTSAPAAPTPAQPVSLKKAVKREPAPANDTPSPAPADEAAPKIAKEAAEAIHNALLKLKQNFDFFGGVGKGPFGLPIVKPNFLQNVNLFEPLENIVEFGSDLVEGIVETGTEFVEDAVDFVEEEIVVPLQEKFVITRGEPQTEEVTEEVTGYSESGEETVTTQSSTVAVSNVSPELAAEIEGVRENMDYYMELIGLNEDELLKLMDLLERGIVEELSIVEDVGLDLFLESVGTETLQEIVTLYNSIADLSQEEIELVQATNTAIKDLTAGTLTGQAKLDALKLVSDSMASARIAKGVLAFAEIGLKATGEIGKEVAKGNIELTDSMKEKFDDATALSIGVKIAQENHEEGRSVEESSDAYKKGNKEYVDVVEGSFEAQIDATFDWDFSTNETYSARSSSSTSTQGNAESKKSDDKDDNKMKEKDDKPKMMDNESEKRKTRGGAGGASKA